MQILSGNASIINQFIRKRHAIAHAELVEACLYTLRRAQGERFRIECIYTYELLSNLRTVIAGVLALVKIVSGDVDVSVSVDLSFRRCRNDLSYQRGVHAHSMSMV
jgi:hypothetical protein